MTLSFSIFLPCRQCIGERYFCAVRYNDFEAMKRAPIRFVFALMTFSELLVYDLGG